MNRVPTILAVVALLAAAGVLATMAFTPRGAATATERVEALSSQLRCPDCEALSVADSRTQAAAAIRGEIEHQVTAGRSDQEIRDYFVASYGEWILLAPPESLVWWLPAAALLAGVGLLATWFGLGRRRVPAGEPAAQAPVAEADRQRIVEELEALDG